MVNREPTNPCGTTYYKCVDKSCPARAATGIDGRGNISLKWHARKPHNHLPKKAENDAHAVLHTFRDAARSNPDRPAKAAYEEVLASRGSFGIDPSTDECLENLGTFEKHKNMFYKIRYENRPTLPKTVDEINFDGLGSLGISLNGGDFYRGTTATKSCVFMSDTQISMAEKSVSLFLDGTFSTCPAPFKQILILRGKIDNSFHTLAYALLPDKKESSYFDVLKAIRDLCRSKGKPLNFKYCHSDCERAILNAVTKIFPNVDLRVCHFHVADAIRRQLGWSD